MKILVIAATKLELEQIQRKLEEENKAHDIYSLVTGVGMIATTFQVTNRLKGEYFDLIINVGIAGSFDRSIALGEVVEVVEDQFSEEMIEVGKKVLTYQEVGLKTEESVLHSTFDIPHSTLKKVSAITVNTVHGNEKSIQEVTERLNPQIESMEGAAFFYVCNQMHVPCMQIRAISNYVEKRDKSAWKIELALNNLAEAIPTILKQL